VELHSIPVHVFRKIILVKKRNHKLKLLNCKLCKSFFLVKIRGSPQKPAQEFLKHLCLSAVLIVQNSVLHSMIKAVVYQFVAKSG